VTGRSAGRDAFAAALALLTGRALTTGELTERLRRRGYDDQSIAAACERAAGYGYLDDPRTAAARAEGAVRLRGYGPRRVRAGLARRLLPREVIEEAAAAVFADGGEERLAREALARWSRTRGGVDDPDRRRAAYAHLRRRGFSQAAARAALFNDPEFL